MRRLAAGRRSTPPAVWDSAAFGIPRRSGFRVVRDFASFGIPRRFALRARYSERMASSGSTRIARRAGTYVAASAESASTATDVASVSGSVDVTP